MFSVSYRVEGDSFVAEKPQEWEAGGFVEHSDFRSYDLHPDGHRFAVRKGLGEEIEDDRDHVVFIQNFFDYLKEKVPVEQ
jgi:hypothetical protein